MTERTVCVAPQFLADVDRQPASCVPEGALYWDVDTWKGGQPALAPAPLSSFTALDCLIRELTRAVWPPGSGGAGRQSRDRVVVIVGNSAGGQFVNRYAIVGREPDALASDGISVRFVIANPSSYLYFSPERPVNIGGVASVNHWRYGFDDPPAYVDMESQQYLERYLRRDVTMVLGAEDRDPAALLLEIHPPAMAQGPNRLERGVFYHDHVQKMAQRAGLPVQHRFVTLPGVGHDAGAVLADQQVLGIVFA
ncbi:MAG TPA: hypothetical protein VGS19_00550 [Streptosporangiaceae bacterium]|nr:hypothetical protein [Streptosporangiaceae bacterium]